MSLEDTSALERHLAALLAEIEDAMGEAGKTWFATLFCEGRQWLAVPGGGPITEQMAMEVSLLPQAGGALLTAMAAEGLSDQDVANRALQMYAIMMWLQSKGVEVRLAVPGKFSGEVRATFMQHSPAPDGGGQPYLRLVKS